jgi:hypothetical protein
MIYSPHMVHLVDKKFGGELSKADVFGVEVSKENCKVNATYPLGNKELSRTNLLANVLPYLDIFAEQYFLIRALASICQKLLLCTFYPLPLCAHFTSSPI